MSLNLKKLEKPAGAWRLRVGDWRAISSADGDFLVAAIGLRKDIYERLDRMRVIRKGEGLAVIEAAAPQREETGARTRATETRRARRPVAVPQNGFSPFEDAMLTRIAARQRRGGQRSCGRCRRASTSARCSRSAWTSTWRFLLADLWERPQHHLETFERGQIPSAVELELREAELSKRLLAPATETEAIATETAAQLRKLLSGSIEEWMVYLHPDQRAIADAELRGPARVRGGPGTGKASWRCTGRG